MKKIINNSSCLILILVVLLGLTNIILTNAQDGTCPNNLHNPVCNGITCGAASVVFTSNPTDVGSLITGTTPIAVVGCPCDDDKDLGVRFTDCDPITQTKTAFYFYRPPAICTGLALPSPITGLPCNLTCSDGTFLNDKTKSCDRCEPGSYSESGKLIVNRFDDHLPLQMKTYCETPVWSSSSTCSSWVLHGEYMDSGDNRDRPFSNSILQLQVDISEGSVKSGNASVSFEYQVDAELYYDYLNFKIDDGDSLLRADQQLTWKQVTFKFDKPGTHILKWTYAKDSSKDEGEDRAKVRNIIVNGIVDLEVLTDCEDCPPGYYSDGSHPCAPCPPNTYADEDGTAVCKTCPVGKTSFLGATDCYLADIPCTETDYSYRLDTQCNEQTREKVYYWIEPKICNETRNDSVTLPPNESFPCDVLTCNNGQKKTENGESCIYCDAGSYGTGSECKTCANNQASIKKSYIIYDVNSGIIPPNPSVFPFTSTCFGECISQGWRDLGNVGLDSGVGNGVSETTILFDNLPEVSLEKDIQPSFRMKYAMSCKASDSSRLDIFVDGMKRKSISCDQCRDLNNINDSDLKLAEVILTDTERKKAPLSLSVSFVTNLKLARNDSYDCNRVLVKSIELFGTKSVGGAISCDECVGGKYPVLDSCVDCNAGYASKAGASKCEICKENQFSYNASSTCYNCGTGMTSSSGSSSCHWKNHEVCVLNTTISTASTSLWKNFDIKKLGELLSTSTGYTSTDAIDSSFYFDICKGGTHKRSFAILSESGNKRFIKNIVTSSSTFEDVCPSSSLACLKNKNGQVIDLGNSLSVDVIKDTSNIGLKLTMMNYQNVCFNNATGTDTSASFTINVICVTDSKNVEPKITTRDGCNYIANIYSAYGCPLCNGDADFNRLEGECKADKRTKTIRYIRKDGVEHKCAFGEDLSSTVKEETCEPLSFQTPLWIIAAVLGGCLLVIIVISLIAAVLFFKYRDVSRRYATLQEEHTVDSSRL
ncbi:hypothetical protein ABK040_012144 [Willaertia magna]